MSSQNEKSYTPQPAFRRLCLMLEAALILAMVLFRFIAGDSLLYRSSRHELTLPPVTAAGEELSADRVYEQRFTLAIERLQTLSVEWGVYLRENSGSVTMELYREADGALLASERFDAAPIADRGTTTLTLDSAQGLCGEPLLLRLSSDSPTGAALLPLLSAPLGDDTLTLNGTPIGGRLCLAASGQERIPLLGDYYWLFAALLALAVGAYLLWSYRRWCRGQAGRLVLFDAAIRRYRFLIKQLVNRDFKAKYKRSVLGIFWSFLNPLLTMSVQYVVFSSLFRFDIPHYPVYLLSGIVMFNFFSEACSLTLTSISGNAALITKVYVPKYIYPLTRVFSSLINLLIALIPLLLVSLVSGIVPKLSYLLIPYPILCLAVFCLGLGMLLATSMVFFRDTLFLWGVLSMIWMYLTPIFYPASILPAQVAWVLKVNPLFYYVDTLRSCILYGAAPDPRTLFMCAFTALAMLLLGGAVFRRHQDEFALFL